jgi:hypothetical protein
MEGQPQLLADRLAPQVEAARLAHQALSNRIAETVLAATLSPTPETIAARDQLNEDIAASRTNLGQLEEAMRLAKHKDALAEIARERAAHEAVIRNFEAACDNGVGFPAPTQVCVAGEAFRHAAGGPALPGARVAHLSLQAQAEKTEPLETIVARSNDYFLLQLRAGFDRRERASMARAEKANGAAS